MGWLKLSCLVIVTAVCGIGAGLGAHALMLSQNPRAAPEPVVATIGGLPLVVPADIVRGSASSPGNRLNLVMRYPGMTAVEARSRPDAASLIFMAIMPADGAMDPSQRIQDLYGRFFEPDAWQNPGGLLMRRFQAGSPYEDEELYLAPPDGGAFSARCRKAGRAGDRAAELVGETCLWRFRRAGADILVRFSPERLPDWEGVAAEVRGLLDRWTTVDAR